MLIFKVIYRYELRRGPKTVQHGGKRRLSVPRLQGQLLVAVYTIRGQLQFTHRIFVTFSHLWELAWILVLNANDIAICRILCLQSFDNYDESLSQCFRIVHRLF